MRILITGGAGFIGSHIAEAYLADGHEVSIVDDFSTGKFANIPHGARIFGGDIQDQEFLERVFDVARPEAVNHHAAVASLNTCRENPRLAYRVNTLATETLLDLSAQYGVKKFVFASSAAVYGSRPHLMPFRESVSLKPQSVYGATKTYAEDMVRAHADKIGLCAVIFRYANVFGPRQEPIGESGVLPIFISALKRDEQPLIYGDPLYTRDYVFVDDVVAANRAVMARNIAGTFNIGTSEETTVIDLLKILYHLIGRETPPRIGPPRSGDIERMALDNTQAEKIFGWAPQIPLVAGIQRTLAAL